MNLLAPVNNTGEITKLSKLGANEFYCGYIPDWWIEKYNHKVKVSEKFERILVSLNKREHLDANVTSFEMLKEMCDEAKQTNSKLFLTLNTIYYSEAVYKDLEEYIKQVVNVGLYGLIVADLGLSAFIKERFPEVKLVLSCINTIRNQWANKMMENIGIDRITFPRHILINDLITITNSAPNLEYECFVFGLGIKCIYDNGNCLTFHSGGAFCQDQWDYWYYPSKKKEFSFDEVKNLFSNEQSFVRWSKSNPERFGVRGGWPNFECGLCTLPDLIKKSKISTLKLEGRGMDYNQKEKIVKLVADTVKLAEAGASSEEIRKMVKETLPDPQLCDLRQRCYMPYSKT